MDPSRLLLFFALAPLLAACSGDPSSSASTGGAGGSGAGGAGGDSTSTSSGTTTGTGGGGGQGGTGTGGQEPHPPADPTTIEGKLMMGYQGWFACKGDGAPPDRWVHWFGAQDPVAANATFDLWPDTTELDADELFPTSMTLKDGSPASLYSAWNTKTVDRHFRWMEDNGLDGVFLQRFLSELSDPAFLAFRDQVAENVRAGAEAHGRVFAIMYDVSGADEATLVDDLEKDWAHLVDDLGLTNSPAHLQDAGRPVLAIWGLGYKDRPGTAAQAAALVDFFRSTAGADKVVTLMGGVPRDWRTLSGDSQTDPAWADVYRSFDIVSPWTVGAFVDDAGADNYRTGTLEPDLAETSASGIRFMPVVFPGFSWTNLNGGALNQIPRSGGKFYWHQVYNALSAGSTMLYGAMFDEVDEGTAMFKIAPTQADLPAQGTFLSLDADGLALPSDFYLQLAGEATRRAHKELPIEDQVPIQP